jgi:serine protease Do
MLLVAAMAFGWTGGACSTTRGQAAREQPAAKAAPQVPEARQVSQAFVGVAERLAPSVVRITTRQQPPSVGRRPGADLNPFEGTPFERFFEDFGHSPQPPPQGRTGMGSGVVIDEQGHILTNNHVVENSDELRVAFVDGKEVEASIVGTDPKTDLAVIKVKPGQAKPAEFGDAERLQVGEWVMAIGNPFGLDHTVTVGVLSAKGRHGFAPGKLEDFLQTDASINPGNSGGPLVNLNGEVIGINTMIAGLGTGVGFAVSESIARPVARQLIEQGKVTRPYIGIAMQALTPHLRSALGEKAPEQGALVSQVQKGSPAERAGIRVGDIVIRVAGKPTADSRAVQHAVLEQKVGDTVKVALWRDGKELEVEVKTAELPADTAGAPRGDGGDGQLGLALQTLTPELADRLGLDRSTKGVLVTSVRPGSSAAEAGLRDGDVIVSVDRQPVATAEQAVKQLASKRSGGHLVRVRRGGVESFLAIPEAGK